MANAISYDFDLENQYNTYIENFYKKNPYGAGYYIESTATDGDQNTVTVSEAIGYGMLITVMMDDKEKFDEINTFFKLHQLPNKLMKWSVYADGTAANGSATDGDLDIAYALLVADQRWGGYKTEAVEIIDSIWKYEIYNQEGFLPSCGDTWLSGQFYMEDSYTRPSDWMPGHFRAFDKVSDHEWMYVVDAIYEFNLKNRHEFSGLLPDFFKGNDPAPANGIEGQYDGDYYYNACRTPLRFAMDDSPEGKEASETIVNFFLGKYDYDLMNMKPGYWLDGTEIGRDYQDFTFISPVASVDVEDDGYMWYNLASYNMEQVFPAALNMLSMLVLSDRWIHYDEDPVHTIVRTNMDSKNKKIVCTISHNHINIFDSSKPVDIVIYNLKGQVQHELTVPQDMNFINVNFLSPGAYVFKLKGVSIKGIIK